MRAATDHEYPAVDGRHGSKLVGVDEREVLGLDVVHRRARAACGDRGGVALAAP